MGTEQQGMSLLSSTTQKRLLTFLRLIDPAKTLLFRGIIIQSIYQISDKVNLAFGKKILINPTYLVSPQKRLLTFYGSSPPPRCCFSEGLLFRDKAFGKNYIPIHTNYSRSNMRQKCVGDSGLWVLNEIDKEKYN